jgi:hypothetical protein
VQLKAVVRLGVDVEVRAQALQAIGNVFVRRPTLLHESQLVQWCFGDKAPRRLMLQMIKRSRVAWRSVTLIDAARSLSELLLAEQRALDNDGDSARTLLGITSTTTADDASATTTTTTTTTTTMGKRKRARKAKADVGACAVVC